MAQEVLAGVRSMIMLLVFLALVTVFSVSGQPSSQPASTKKPSMSVVTNSTAVETTASAVQTSPVPTSSYIVETSSSFQSPTPTMQPTMAPSKIRFISYTSN